MIDIVEHNVAKAADFVEYAKKDILETRKTYESARRVSVHSRS